MTRLAAQNYVHHVKISRGGGGGRNWERTNQSIRMNFERTESVGLIFCHKHQCNCCTVFSFLLKCNHFDLSKIIILSIGERLPVWRNADLERTAVCSNFRHDWSHYFVFNLYFLFFIFFFSFFFTVLSFDMDWLKNAQQRGFSWC